jgi:hypothetical protein
MSIEPRDRLITLQKSTILNGIDFVEIASQDQTILRVHFLNANPIAPLTSIDVTISGGETIPTVSVQTINDATDWTTDNGHLLLTLFVDSPGDFSFYTLSLKSTLLDPFYNHVTFSFKALCPSDLDCATPALVCPPIEGDMPPIDYLAKDFMSFRQALSDFSAQRYPEWQERSEADFGMMFMEALCSLADDLSYLQDRVAAEAMLDTATQRRSIVRLARLVDYEPSPAIAASVSLQIDVQDGVTSLPSGLKVLARGPDGLPIYFETGTGLIDEQTGKLNNPPFNVNSAWNRGNIQPYWLDDSQICLKAGATSMWIAGHVLTDTTGGNVHGITLLLDTTGATTADPPIREVVHLTLAHPTTDQLFRDQPVTQIFWPPEDALQFDHDLARTVLASNLIPATQGDSYSEQFAIDIAPVSYLQVPLAIVRIGPNDTPETPSVQYLWTLQNARLAWLAQDNPDQLPLPEIILEQQTQPLPPDGWRWRRSLLGAATFESAFTVDPVHYIAVARNPDQTVSYEYDGDAGDTIRFGDGIFGEVPEQGAVFQVTYRVGGGANGNVAADSITNVDPTAIAFIKAVTNPFAAAGGADEETDERVRRLAPQAFRAQQFRAVRLEDYEAAAERLPWVLQAGTTFRWTGSWLTVFTTADPKGSETISIDQHIELSNLLNRYRLAGYESYVPAPFYVSLDLIITVCAQSNAFRGDVEAGILSALSAQKFLNGKTGFFYFDHFTFGTLLVRSALEAAIQNAYGVAGVISICYRQHGVTLDYTTLPATVFVPPHQILRVDNDPSRPERGSIQVIVEGRK